MSVMPSPAAQPSSGSAGRRRVRGLQCPDAGRPLTDVEQAHGRPSTGARSSVRRSAAAFLAVVGLSACRVDTVVDVRLDASGAGTVEVAVVADAEVVKAAPGLADDLRVADLEPAGWIVEGPTATPEGGLSLTLQRPFATPQEATSILAQLSGPDGPFHDLTVDQRRAFARVDSTLRGSIRLDNELGSFVDNGVLAAIGGQPYADTLSTRQLDVNEALGIRIRLHAPGRLQLTDGTPLPAGEAQAAAGGSTGTSETTSLEWTAQLDGAAVGDGQPISAEIRLADAGARSARRWRDFTPWAAAAWLALVLGVVAPLTSLLSRRRRRRV